MSSHAHERNSTDARVPSLKPHNWECKYHVVFIPKCRRKPLYLELRRHLGEVFHKFAVLKEAKIEEGHLMPVHVHMLISIPPKYAGRSWSGSSKARAIHLAHFWARGTSSTRSVRTKAIRTYIRNQEKEDQRLEQLNVWR